MYVHVKVVDFMISVIVPVYNVEKYLRECLDSIIGQTYRNIEIILIDDGSTDNSGIICDEYALYDKRIKVIHKENGGLSDARNCGLSVASGDIVSFIDSDDYVSPYFLEILYEAMEKGNCDIAALKDCCAFWDGDDCGALSKVKHVIGLEYCTPSKAIEHMFYMHVITGAQFKLYKRYILGEIKFPVGYYYEDVATTYKAFLYSKKAVIVDADIYAYRKRKNSICREEFSEKKLSALKIFDDILSDERIKELGLLQAAKARVYPMLFSVFLQIPKKNIQLRRIVWEKLKEVRFSVLFDSSGMMRKKNRIASFISLFGMEITYFIGREYGQKGTMSQ